MIQVSMASSFGFGVGKGITDEHFVDHVDTTEKDVGLTVILVSQILSY